MELPNLQLSRTLQKDPVQSSETKGAVFNSQNPTPKGSVNNSGGDQNRGNDKDDGSKEVLTGTRIISCFIQTSGLPSRIEIAGNDIKLFDDTRTENGVIKGDTSRIFFTHDLDSDEGFVIEKRSSLQNTYDNVLSIYATPAKTGFHNYMFIGRNGDINDAERNINLIQFNINRDSSVVDSLGGGINGTCSFEYSIDGVLTQTNFTPLKMGNSASLFPGSGITGFSSLVIAGAGGYSGIGYANASVKTQVDILFYAVSSTQLKAGATILPDVTATYNLGSPSFKFGTFYGSVSACPLPTVDNALEILDTIVEPTFVGDRGHYGDRKYFDDLGFPEALLWTNNEGYKDIEHNHMLGFLLKVVKELKAEVDTLKSRLP